MYVDAVVRVYISTDDVDKAGSLKDAVENEYFGQIEAVDLDNWTWQYDSDREYAWANAFPNQILTGEPYEDDDTTD